jgi:hypothetical protein
MSSAKFMEPLCPIFTRISAVLGRGDKDGKVAARNLDKDDWSDSLTESAWMVIQRATRIGVQTLGRLPGAAARIV